MVRMDQVNRFYYRHSAGKDIMNVSQLRAAFALTSRLDEQIAGFHRDRMSGIKSGNVGYLTPSPGPTVIMHVEPFESFRSGFVLDLEAAMTQAQLGLQLLGRANNGQRYTLDGIYCFDDVNRCNAYTLVFRNGIIETASRNLFVTNLGQTFIPCGRPPEDVLRHLESAMGFYQSLNVPPPFAVMVTLTGVGEYVFQTAAPGRRVLPSPR